MVLILVGCGQPDKKSIVAEFNVDKSLLSDSAFVTGSGFSIYPPAHWLKTDSYNDELKRKILYRLDNRLLTVFKSDSADCALIISELPEPTFATIKELMKSNSFLNGDSIWTSVQPSVFSYRNYEIVQIVSQNSELIVFKLFTHHLNELYELDYIVPRNIINLLMKSVESSIGSMN